MVIGYVVVRGLKSLSNKMKGGYHISCPYGCVGRGRVRMVTCGLNLPWHGIEKARRNAGRTQSGVPAKAAGRSIKRMVQLRKRYPDGNNWESPGEG